MLAPINDDLAIFNEETFPSTAILAEIFWIMWTDEFYEIIIITDNGEIIKRYEYMYMYIYYI